MTAMLNDTDSLNLLHNLVSIPSVSEAEGRAVAFLVEWMSAHEMSAHVDAAGNAVGIVEAAPDPDGGTAARDRLARPH